MRMHIEWGWQAGKDDKRKYCKNCKLQNDNEDAHRVGVAGVSSSPPFNLSPITRVEP